MLRPRCGEQHEAAEEGADQGARGVDGVERPHAQADPGVLALALDEVAG